MNWIAVIVAALVPMAIGFAWYHEKVLGKTWRETLGFSQEDIGKGNMPLIFGLSIVMALLLSFFLSSQVNHGGENFEASYGTFKHGAFHGFFYGLLGAIPVMVSNSLFQRNSLKNIGINVAYWLITITIMGGILGAWQ